MIFCLVGHIFGNLPAPRPPPPPKIMEYHYSTYRHYSTCKYKINIMGIEVSKQPYSRKKKGRGVVEGTHGGQVLDGWRRHPTAAALPESPDAKCRAVTYASIPSLTLYLHESPLRKTCTYLVQQLYYDTRKGEEDTSESNIGNQSDGV